MSMPDLRLITAPAALPVTVDQVKARLRIGHSFRDDELTMLIRAQVAALDGKAGELFRCLMPQRWEMALSAFPACADGRIILPLGPVAAIDSIKFTDAAGLEQTIDPAAYVLNPADGLDDAYVAPLYATSWPSARLEARAVRIRYQAGYALISASEAAAQAAVPDCVRAAIILTVAGLESGQVPPEATIAGLLAPVKRPMV